MTQQPATEQPVDQKTNQETITIYGKTILHTMLLPAGIYTNRSLQEWVKQEELNNTLWLAVTHNQPAKTIVKLIAMGANIHHTYNNRAYQADGVTPLHIAAGNHNVALVTALLQLGANADQKDTAGNSPLDWVIIFREFNRQRYSNEQITEQYQKIIRLLIMCEAQDQSQKYLSIFFPQLIQ
jgi:ankyrin repeat protein